MNKLKIMLILIVGFLVLRTSEPDLLATLIITYPSGYHNVPNFSDWEYLGYEKECDWTKGYADSLDWSSPGHQY